MNDRFKFRAWDKEQKKMFYNAQMTYDYSLVSDACEADSFGTVLTDDNMIVMQCTGLKDKNGKLIYEGDIVKEFYTDFINFSGNHAIVVEWDNLNASYNFENLQNCEREVIGNIYENKELLEG
jgi:uncharacterized phage protein (TIGR01671 family)